MLAPVLNTGSLESVEAGDLLGCHVLVTGLMVTLLTSNLERRGADGMIRMLER